MSQTLQVNISHLSSQIHPSQEQDCLYRDLYSTLTEGINVLRSPRAACPAQRVHADVRTFSCRAVLLRGARLPVGHGPCTAAFHAPSSPRRRPHELRYESKTPATRRSLHGLGRQLEAGLGRGRAPAAAAQRERLGRLVEAEQQGGAHDGDLRVRVTVTVRINVRARARVKVRVGARVS